MSSQSASPNLSRATGVKESDKPRDREKENQEFGERRFLLLFEVIDADFHNSTLPGPPTCVLRTVLVLPACLPACH